MRAGLARMQRAGVHASLRININKFIVLQGLRAAVQGAEKAFDLAVSDRSLRLSGRLKPALTGTDLCNIFFLREVIFSIKNGMLKMTKIAYVTFQGSETATDAKDGETLLQVAHANEISGIVGECGGCLSCATCHVYVDDAWLDKLPPVQPDENTMLDGTYCDREANSRLACQIKVTPALDGLVVRLPERQN